MCGSKVQRETWIDWMKVLGIFTIIWGHCFPYNFSDFLYAFNVPVFFFLSGYLSKREPQRSVFWRKTIKRLWVPYLLLSVLKALPHYGSTEGLWSFLGILTGFHTLNDVMGCGKLWFVYTLIIIRIIFQYTNDTKTTKCSILCISLIGALVCNYYLDDVAWAVANTFLALPWFLLGHQYSLSKYKVKLSNLLIQLPVWQKLSIVALLWAVTYAVSYYNGCVSTYLAEYGNNILLYFIAGITGTLSILVLSYAIKYQGQSLRQLSMGTIVILAYHQDVNHPLLKFVRQQEWAPLLDDFSTFVCSIITLLAFIPIIYIVSRYLPVFIGYRSANN